MSDVVIYLFFKNQFNQKMKKERNIVFKKLTNRYLDKK